MKRILSVFLSLLFLLSLVQISFASENSDMTPYNLTVEYLTNPTGIDIERPHFAWKLSASGFDRFQSAYQIILSDKEDFSNIIYDSGKVESNAQNQIEYDGEKLQSRTTYYWSVTVWDESDLQGNTATAFFHTGDFDNSWTAQWITQGTSYPKAEITFPKESARYIKLDVSKLGEMVNGESGYRLQLAEFEVYSNGENMALNKTVLAKDSFTNASWNPGCMVDGKRDSSSPTQGFTTNLYSSQNTSLWVTVDLGAIYEVDRVVLYARNDTSSQNPPYAANFPKSYTVALSEDNAIYTTVYTVENAEIPMLSSTALPIMAKDFTVDETKEIDKAFAYASAPGMFIITINGKNATDAYFEPGETNFDKKVFYSTYDITDKIQKGKNAVGTLLGKGFYHNPAVSGRFNRSPKIWGDIMFFCQIEILYTDGTKDIIATDDTWYTSTGAITESVWLGGEDYNANLEKKGFDEPGFDYSSWEKAKIAQDIPFSVMEGKKHENLTLQQEISPVEIIKIADKKYLVDFGINTVGSYKFKGEAVKDTTVTFLPSENINSDNTVNQSSTLFGSTKIFDTYTFRGEGLEEYTPNFVYHGFRYLQIEGYDVTADSITMLEIYCDNPVASTIETSDDDINEIMEIIRRSVAANMYNVYTDCPHREKLGWLEVPNLLYNTISGYYDISSYMTKISNDINEAQKESGSVPSIVPPLTVGISEHALRPGPDDTPNDPNWCGSIVLVPYYSYLKYGNLSQLEVSYTAMNNYMTYLTSLAQSSGGKYILESSELNRDLGDWVYIDYTDTTFVVSCTYYHLANTMSKIALLLNDSAVAEEYALLAQNIKDAINTKFLHNTYYSSNTQSSNAIPLYYGIVPKDKEKVIAHTMAEKVIEEDYHFTTGEVGMYPLLAMLSKYGYNLIAYKLITAEGYPGYKNFLSMGKTSLPEVWSGGASQNHAILGHGAAWVFENLGGIKDISGKVTVAPYIPSDLRYLAQSTSTIYGDVSVSWKKVQKNVEMTLSIPVNCTADIVIPSNKTNEITINGDTITSFEVEKENTLTSLSSGEYTIVFPRSLTDTDLSITGSDFEYSDDIQGVIFMENKGENEETLILTTAIYSSDNTLSYVSTAPVTLFPGSNEIPVSIGGLSEGSSFKILAWNDSLMPYSECVGYKAVNVHENVGDVIEVNAKNPSPISLSGTGEEICDGNLATTFTSNNGIGDYVGIEFAKEVSFNRVNVYFNSWQDGARMSGCVIEARVDGEWIEAVSLPTNYDGMDNKLYPFSLDCDSTIKCDAIRLIRKNANTYAAWITNPNALNAICEITLEKVVTEDNITIDYIILEKIN